MPPKVDFSDTGEDPVAPLPVKRGSINRPDRDELAAASAVAENAGFATRSTASSIDPVPGRESEGIRRRRKPGRPKGPPTERVTFELYAEDLQRFRDLCDDDWDGVPYKHGFRTLLEAYAARAERGSRSR